MSITITSSAGNLPLTVTVHGPVTAADIIQCLHKLARCNRESGMVWDLRRADLRPITCPEVGHIVETITAVLPNENTYRVAIVGVGDLEFGLYRVFQCYAEIRGLKRFYGYFLDPLAAHGWVCAEIDPAHTCVPWQPTNGMLLAS